MVHLLENLEIYAKENNIPIMQKDGLEFLCSYIKKNNVKKILEIGTAIGYSSIAMASISKEIEIITLERDEKMYQLACSNIKKARLSKQIIPIKIDALEFEVDKSFDLIFIDAAKGQYIRFFERFEQNLKREGTIISDNLSFHGLVEGDVSKESRNVRGIVRKIKDYIEFLNQNEKFNTQFLKIGDGIGLTTYKNS